MSSETLNYFGVVAVATLASVIMPTPTTAKDTHVLPQRGFVRTAGDFVPTPGIPLFTPRFMPEFTPQFRPEQFGEDVFMKESLETLQESIDRMMRDMRRHQRFSPRFEPRNQRPDALPFVPELLSVDVDKKGDCLSLTARMRLSENGTPQSLTTYEIFQRLKDTEREIARSNQPEIAEINNWLYNKFGGSDAYLGTLERKKTQFQTAIDSIHEAFETESERPSPSTKPETRCSTPIS